MRQHDRVDILGTLIDKVSLSETVDLAESYIRTGEPHRIGMANVAKVVKSRSDQRLRELVNSADLIGADGVPLVWVSKLVGSPLPGRVNGTDLMEALLDLAARNGYRVYLLGATKEVLAKAEEAARILHPRLCIAGRHHGYFEEHEEAAIVEAIRCSRADILLVGMSTPRKEEFMSRYLRQMNVPVCHGVGGSFDILAGEVKRAPGWMQQCGLEWLFRLLKEPARMWRRYLETNSRFIILVAKLVMARLTPRRSKH